MNSMSVVSVAIGRYLPEHAESFECLVELLSIASKCWLYIIVHLLH